MITSLPMYDRPEIRADWQVLWDVVRARAGVDLPKTLTWGSELHPQWLRDDLILSQTCSLPYRTGLHGKARLLGAFDFGLPGCPPGYYNSVIVIRRETPIRASEGSPALTLAYNAADSQSGWAAPLFWLQSKGLELRAGLETGAHHASAVAVAEGHADFAAIDAQTYRLLTIHEPELTAALIEWDRTEPTPGLPLIAGQDSPITATNLAGIEKDLAEDVAARLGLEGFVAFPPAPYLTLPIPPDPSEIFPT